MYQANCITVNDSQKRSIGWLEQHAQTQRAMRTIALSAELVGTGETDGAAAAARRSFIEGVPGMSRSDDTGMSAIFVVLGTLLGISFARCSKTRAWLRCKRQGGQGGPRARQSRFVQQCSLVTATT